MSQKAVVNVNVQDALVALGTIRAYIKKPGITTVGCIICDSCLTFLAADTQIEVRVDVTVTPGGTTNNPSRAIFWASLSDLTKGLKAQTSKEARFAYSEPAFTIHGTTKISFGGLVRRDEYESGELRIPYTKIPDETPQNVLGPAHSISRALLQQIFKRTAVSTNPSDYEAEVTNSTYFSCRTDPSHVTIMATNSFSAYGIYVRDAALAGLIEDKPLLLPYVPTTQKWIAALPKNAKQIYVRRSQYETHFNWADNFGAFSLKLKTFRTDFPPIYSLYADREKTAAARLRGGTKTLIAALNTLKPLLHDDAATLCTNKGVCYVKDRHTNTSVPVSLVWDNDICIDISPSQVLSLLKALDRPAFTAFIPKNPIGPIAIQGQGEQNGHEEDVWFLTMPVKPIEKGEK